MLIEMLIDDTKHEQDYDRCSYRPYTMPMVIQVAYPMTAVLLDSVAHTSPPVQAMSTPKRKVLIKHLPYYDNVVHAQNS